MPKLLPIIEHAVKGPVWDCRMCGQCVLHSTGMTCPMTCPKTLRNGPCGGVRENGHCEVVPEMRCVWVKAEERSRTLPLLPKSWREHIHELRPPVEQPARGRGVVDQPPHRARPQDPGRVAGRSHCRPTTKPPPSSPSSSTRDPSTTPFHSPRR